MPIEQPEPEHPLPQNPRNAPGDFHTLANLCLACGAPQAEAPDLIDFDPNDHGCCFKRQPATPEEREQAINAVSVGCCGVVRYGGDDPEILAALDGPWSRSSCDRAIGPLAPQAWRTEFHGADQTPIACRRRSRFAPSMSWSDRLGWLLGRLFGWH
jgi:hypothetical protein